jgi:ankyrin repeat protein
MMCCAVMTMLAIVYSTRIASRLFFMQLMYVGAVEVIELFLKHGVDINYQDTFSGNTVLHHAAIAGLAGTTGWLLKRGANSQIVNKQGKKPIRYAKDLGTKELLRAVEPSSCSIQKV